MQQSMEHTENVYCHKMLSTTCSQHSTQHFELFLLSKSSLENTLLGQLLSNNPNLTLLYEGIPAQSGHTSMRN